MSQPEAKFEPHVTGLYTAPPWLRDLGATSWLGVGVALMVVATVWLLTLTNTIVAPVITGTIIAAVASPLVRRLHERGISRGVGSALVLLALIVLAGAVILAVLTGIGSQLDELKNQLASAKQHLANGLHDLGVESGTAKNAVSDASSGTTSAVSTLLNGVGHALSSLSSIVIFLSFTALSVFFLLKDAPLIRGWTERHLRLPPETAHQVTSRVLESLRGYFLGVTIIAAFNAVVVTLGALILGVPDKGAIAVVTFLGAYVPFLGAWAAGAFAVLIALGASGTDAAIGMAIVQLLANGVLQQLVQPIAYSAALGIHPLAVLIVTIGGGALFGTVGLILAAPLTAALTRIATDFADARAPAQTEARAPA